MNRKEKKWNFILSLMMGFKSKEIEFGQTKEKARGEANPLLAKEKGSEAFASSLLRFIASSLHRFLERQEG